MDSLIDKVLADKWEEIDASKIEGLVEYHIQRGSKRIDEHTMGYIIQAGDDDDPIEAICPHLLKDKNPLQGIGSCELKLADGTIVAMNLNGDCIVPK